VAVGQNTTVVRNAIMAVAQAVVSGIVLFLLFRYLLRTVGPEQIGIWAVVLATASASRISEMGLTGSAVKFTAGYLARGELGKASDVIQTTAITVGVVLACVLMVGYWVIIWLVGKIIVPANVPGALAILPYALVSVWIGAVAGVFLSGLDGCQRIDLRALVTISTSIVLLGLSWSLVPQYRLVGLACAQIGQGVAMLLLSWGLLRQELPALPLLPRSWRYSLFREMFRYGVNFQLISIFALLFEPTTKALMAKFGGLTSTAYYEMANRMVMQFRALLVSANQVMVPRVASLNEDSPETIQNVYLVSYRVVFFLSLPLYAIMAAAAPLASEIWIGYYEKSFVLYSVLLVAGFWLNTLSGPAYFVNLGTGSLHWITLAHVLIGILNVSLGYMLGGAYGGSGVVLGYVVALVFGSSLVVVSFHRDNRISHKELLSSESRALFVACCVALLVGWGVFHFVDVPEATLGRAALTLTVCVVGIVPMFWVHPLRSKISAGLAVALGRKAGWSTQ
jgi:O-antigen/teichoic acid export membrane protein